MSRTAWSADYDGQQGQQYLAHKRLRPVFAGTLVGVYVDDNLLIVDAPDDMDAGTIRTLVQQVLGHSNLLPLARAS